jgi:UDP:flavonoid glycosyltransferase YjiC (YdhE family)
MARILFTWELGGGMGHVVPYLETINAIHKTGHRLYFAMRDLSFAEQVFHGLPVTYFQAPCRIGPVTHPVKTSHTYAHILHNIGFSDSTMLAGLVNGWRALFELLQPDLIVFNHSPTALLAARTFPAKRLLTGTGFTIPPKRYPFPNMRYWSPIDETQLRHDEDGTLAAVNHVLKKLGSPPLSHLADLFDVDCDSIDSYAELDHYPNREGRRYRGACFSEAGHAPAWPEGSGKKIFVYIKSSIANPSLFAALKESGQRAIIFGDSIPEPLQRRFASDALRFVDQPQNIRLVAAHADVAVLNGGHNTTAAMLLAGKPVLILPLTIEQYLTARNVERLGAGVTCLVDKPGQIISALRQVLESESCVNAARNFAQKYSDAPSQNRKSPFLKNVMNLLS